MNLERVITHIVFPITGGAPPTSWLALTATVSKTSAYTLKPRPDPFLSRCSSDTGYLIDMEVRVAD